MLSLWQDNCELNILAYDPPSGLLQSVAHLDGGPGVQYAFDIMDRVTDITWLADGGSTLRGFAMDYDNADMITNVGYASGEQRIYTYDSINRLTGETHVDSSDAVIYSATYEYDLAGNRTQSVINGVTNTYTLGLGNRLASWTGGSYAHDAAGNVTNITDTSGTRELSWDIQYRLTGVAVDGSPVETYGYDPLGRRAWTFDGSVTNWHVHDGMHLVADLDDSGELLRSYTWGPGIDTLLALTVHGTTETNTYYAITDHLGTVHALADDTGSIVESYRYDAWGNILEVRDAAGNLLTSDLGRPASALGNRFLFQGREYSWATGLYNFRARWYDPVTGRWLSKDPIGISGGLNQYVAFGNNPVMFIDPDGMDVKNLSKQWILVKLGDDYVDAAGNTKQQWLMLEPGGTFVGGQDGIMWQNGMYYKVSGDNADIEVECEGKAKSDIENWFGDLVKRILPGKRELSGYYNRGDGSIVGNTWDPGTLLDVIKKRNQK